MSKTKFPRAVALNVARAFCYELNPVCERIIVAGSLRRRKEMVGDVEIVYVARCVTESADLFATKEVNLVDRMLDEWLKRGFIVKREHNGGGVVSWGQWNKYAVHVATGVPIDFFATTHAAWFNYLVCRTGGEVNNTLIASEAIRKRWTWHPTKQGFTNEHGAVVPVESEQDVYQLLGLPYREPWERL